MTKSIKRKGIVLSVLAVLACCFLALTFASAKVSATESVTVNGETISSEDFKVSAAVRLVDDFYGNGVRFTVSLPIDKFNALCEPIKDPETEEVTGYGEITDGVTTGVLLTTKKIYESKTVDLSTIGSTDAETNATEIPGVYNYELNDKWHKDGDYYCAYIVIYSVPEAGLDTILKVVPYITYKDKETSIETSAVKTDATAASMRYVCFAATEGKEELYNQLKDAYLKCKLTVKYEGASESIEDKVFEGYYHETISGAMTASPTLAGYTPDKPWISKYMEGNATETVTYSATDLSDAATYTLTIKYVYEDGTTAHADTIVSGIAANTVCDKDATVSPEIAGYLADKPWVEVLMNGNKTVTVTYGKASVWDGESKSSGLSGSGTAADPYLIQSAADLKYLVDASKGTHYGNGLYYKLTTNIDWNGNVWQPIAFKSYSDNTLHFKGTFDGDGHIVAGLATETTNARVGFFQTLGGGSVKNLTVQGDFDVSGSNGRVGGIAYCAYGGTVDNCNVYLDVTARSSDGAYIGGFFGSGLSSAPVATVVTNSRAYGTFTNMQNYVGGINGYTAIGGDKVESCESYIDISGKDYIGGICGVLQGGAVKNCVNYGTISTTTSSNGTGGIVGSVNNEDRVKSITDCANYGSVTAPQIVGGIIGWNQALNATDAVSYCVNYGTVTATQTAAATRSYAGGIVGSNPNRDIVNCVNHGDVIACGPTVGGIVGYNNNAITLSNNTNTGTIRSATTESVDQIYGYVADGTTVHSNNIESGEVRINGDLYLKLTIKYQYQDGTQASEDKVLRAFENSYIGSSSGVSPTLAGYTPDKPWISKYMKGNATETVTYKATNPTDTATYTLTIKYVYENGESAGDDKVVSGIAANTVSPRADTVSPAITGYLADKPWVEVLMNDNKTVTVTYGTVSVWDGSSVSTGLSGSGTAADPYLIQSAADLKWLVEDSKGINGYGAGKYYSLTTNIDWGGESKKYDWYPICWDSWARNSMQFRGIIEGNDHVIAGIYSTNSRNGLFQVLGGTLKNVTICAEYSGAGNVGGVAYGLIYNAKVENVNVYIDLEKTNNTGSSGYSGGIYGTGYNDSTVDVRVTNCRTYGSMTMNALPYLGGIGGYLATKTTVSGCESYITLEGLNYVGGIAGIIAGSSGSNIVAVSSVENCVNYGMVNSAAGQRVGGIVGQVGALANVTIQDCVNSGTVYTKGNYAGGIVGSSNEKTTMTIERCVNYGSVSSAGNSIGGIVGETFRSIIAINYCVNRGSVAGNTIVGGIVGWTHDDKNYGESISGCTNYGTVTSTNTSTGNACYAGGIVGSNPYATIENCVNNGEVYAFGRGVAGIVGWNENAITITGNKNNGTISVPTGQTQAGQICGYKNSGTDITSNTSAGEIVYR